MRNAKLDPAVQHELDLLDAALAGERTDLEVAIIADEARNAAEPMPPGLALRLEAAIAEGFAKPSKPRRSWIMGPAVGVAAAGVIAVVVALGGSGSDEDSTFSSGGSTAVQSESAGGGREAAPNVAQDSAGTALPPQPQLSEPVPPQPSGDAAPRERKVQRAAELTLTTPLADLQETSDEVTRTTDRLGGYVQNSDVHAGEERGRASFDLRIPADRLDDALAALSKLGHVQSRTQQSEDITARFTSARARLQDARGERQALLRALAEADTTAEIDSIKQRLEIANARIAAAKGDLFAARRAASLVQVSVVVIGTEGEDGAGAPGGDDPWTPGKALGDAVDVLSVAASVLIVALAASIPAGLVLLLVALGYRSWRKRSRDLALGGTPV